MNKFSFIAATLLGFAAFSAQSGELYAPQSASGVTSGLSRAQVKQSVLEARRAGQLDHNEVDLPGNGTLMTPDDTFGNTRAAVKADVLAARAGGELDHNDIDLPHVATGSALSRKDVRAAAISARQLVKLAPGRNTIDY